jgi:hypothetical protein
MEKGIQMNPIGQDPKKWFETHMKDIEREGGLQIARNGIVESINKWEKIISSIERMKSGDFDTSDCVEVDFLTARCGLCAIFDNRPASEINNTFHSFCHKCPLRVDSLSCANRLPYWHIYRIISLEYEYEIDAPPGHTLTGEMMDKIENYGKELIKYLNEIKKLVEGAK